MRQRNILTIFFFLVAMTSFNSYSKVINLECTYKATLDYSSEGKLYDYVQKFVIDTESKTLSSPGLDMILYVSPHYYEGIWRQELTASEIITYRSHNILPDKILDTRFRIGRKDLSYYDKGVNKFGECKVLKEQENKI